VNRGQSYASLWGLLVTAVERVSGFAGFTHGSTENRPDGIRIIDITAFYGIIGPACGTATRKEVGHVIGIPCRFEPCSLEKITAAILATGTPTAVIVIPNAMRKKGYASPYRLAESLQWERSPRQA